MVPNQIREVNRQGTYLVQNKAKELATWVENRSNKRSKIGVILKSGTFGEGWCSASHTVNRGRQNSLNKLFISI